MTTEDNAEKGVEGEVAEVVCAWKIATLEFFEEEEDQ